MSPWRGPRQCPVRWGLDSNGMVMCVLPCMCVHVHKKKCACLWYWGIWAWDHNFCPLQETSCNCQLLYQADSLSHIGETLYYLLIYWTLDFRHICSHGRNASPGGVILYLHPTDVTTEIFTAKLPKCCCEISILIRSYLKMSFFFTNLNKKNSQESPKLCLNIEIWFAVMQIVKLLEESLWFVKLGYVNNSWFDFFFYPINNWQCSLRDRHSCMDSSERPPLLAYTFVTVKQHCGVI